MKLYFVLMISLAFLGACASQPTSVKQSNNTKPETRTVASSEVIPNHLTVTGKRAYNLYKTLSDFGAGTDCGAGTCGTEVSELQCLRHANSTNNPSFECTYKAQSEDGSMVPTNLQGSKAEKLIRVLGKVGLDMDCGAGTCGMETSALSCVFRNGEKAANYRCDISLPSEE